MKAEIVNSLERGWEGFVRSHFILDMILSLYYSWQKFVWSRGYDFHERLFCFPSAQTFSVSCLLLSSHKHCVAANEASVSCSMRSESRGRWARCRLDKMVLPSGEVSMNLFLNVRRSVCPTVSQSCYFLGARTGGCWVSSCFPPLLILFVPVPQRK